MYTLLRVLPRPIQPRKKNLKSTFSEDFWGMHWLIPGRGNNPWSLQCSCYQTPLIKNCRGLLSFALDLWLIVPLDISWHHLTMFICSLLSLLYSLDGEEPYGPYAIVTTSKRVSQLGYGHKNNQLINCSHRPSQGRWMTCMYCLVWIRKSNGFLIESKHDWN